MCLGCSLSKLANFSSSFKTQLSLCLLSLTNTDGAHCLCPMYISQSSFSDTGLQSLFFFFKAPLVRVLRIFASPASTYLLDRRKKSVERRSLYCSRTPPDFCQLDSTSSTLLWINALGLGLRWFQPIPVTLCEPKEPFQMGQ